MHIADGILSPEVCAVTGAISLGAVAYSLHKLKDSLAEKTIPMTGMMSALIFAGQMVNFPLLVMPVSGHLMGGVLAAALLGPWAGCIAVTLVLLVQCALFADGGMTALGANVLHMAVIGSMGGYAVYSAIRYLLGKSLTATITGVVLASWISVLAAAALFCVEFRCSYSAGDFNFSNLFTLMVSAHSLIGIGEALITGLTISFILSQRRDLLFTPDTASNLLKNTGRFTTAGIVCALAVAAFLAPFASELPDGLDSVAQRLSFEGESNVLILDDYSLPLPIKGWQESAQWRKISVSLAGIVGSLSILTIAAVLGRAIKLRTSHSGTHHDD